MGLDESSRVGWLRYDQSFREDAHQLLAWGYQDSRGLLTCDLEETEITGCIADAIQARLDAPQTEERFDRYTIKEDNPVSGEGRTGKSRMRIDIIIEANRPRPRPRYVFEAKRLRKPSHPISKYVGSEGLMRFIGDRYAPGCPEAGLIGYVQTDTVEHWITELERQFSQKPVNRFRITEKLCKTLVIGSLPNTWASNHNRVSGSPITIFHLLLDCL